MFKSSLLNWIASTYRIFLNTGNNLQSLFLFYMRATWGYQFFILGLYQLHSIEHVAQFFHTLSIPSPILSAYFVAVIEIVCGFFLLIGFASRIITIPLIIIMLIALSTAHAPNISNFRFLFEPLSLVKQEPYPFLITAFLVFIFGPGKLSVDGWLKRWAEKHARY